MLGRQRAEASPERRDLLSGDRPLSLPWTDAARLMRLCTGCGACAKACPQRILRIERGTRPVLEFSAPCLFCGACAEACPEGVFDPGRSPPWDAVASVGEACLEGAGISCRACEDACEARALRARPLPGGRAVMTVDMDACSGCGACLPVCPTGAIAVRRPAREKTHGA